MKIRIKKNPYSILKVKDKTYQAVKWFKVWGYWVVIYFERPVDKLLGISE